MMCGFIGVLVVLCCCFLCREFEVSAAATDQNLHLDVGSDMMWMDMLETMIWSEFGSKLIALVSGCLRRSVEIQLFLSRLDPQLQASFFISRKEKLGLLFVLLVVSEQLIQLFQ